MNRPNDLDPADVEAIQDYLIFFKLSLELLVETLEVAGTLPPAAYYQVIDNYLRTRDQLVMDRPGVVALLESLKVNVAHDSGKYADPRANEWVKEYALRIVNDAERPTELRAWWQENVLNRLPGLTGPNKWNWPTTGKQSKH
jgi:hypothetical protein